MNPFTEFHSPRTLDEALEILRDNAAACVLAGGTDVMVRVRRGVVPAERTTLLSVHRIAGMRGCRRENGELVVGAATTATDLGREPLVAECAPILAHVADRLASAQVRKSSRRA